MSALTRQLLDRVNETFGRPASVRRALDAHPELRVLLPHERPCIALDSVPRWHELGLPSSSDGPVRERGQLLGWSSSGPYYQSFELRRPEYARLTTPATINDWTCDISELDGFAWSQSTLEHFSHTDAMVEANSPELIAEISPAALAKNLAHREIRILHPHNTEDHFVRHSWDARLWLVNNGGSHHLAAAKYIATRLGIKVPLRGRLRTHALNEDAIATLRRDFELFVMSTVGQAWCAFHAAMRACGVTWLWHPMPRPFDRETVAVLLPKTEGRSRRVADELRRAGLLDLGELLRSAAATTATPARLNANR